MRAALDEVCEGGEAAVEGREPAAEGGEAAEEAPGWRCTGEEAEEVRGRRGD